MDWGYGSVYQRKDGIWIASCERPRAKGEPRARRLTFGSKDRDIALLKLAAYRAEHPPREWSRAGRAAHMEAARARGTHTPREWWALVRATQGACAYCGVKTLDFQMDHKVAVSRGGSDAIDNIAVSCRDCNLEKGVMSADEYLAWKQAA